MEKQVQAAKCSSEVAQLGVLRRRELALEVLDDPQRRGRDGDDEEDLPDEGGGEDEGEVCAEIFGKA